MSSVAHAQYLAETIGPRGSTTSKESQAAQYAVQTLRQAGLEPTLETFRSARSGWWPYALYSGLVLVAVALFLAGGQAGALTALVLTIVSLVSVLLELAFRPNPLRWILPRGESQNVCAQIAPAGPPRQQMVLVGHLDSHRTPLAFSTDAWLQVFRLLVPVGLLSSLVLVALFALALFLSGPPWRWLVLPPMLVLIGLFLLTLQADTTPYTAGANDNATGAGLVLGMAERLARQPLRGTTVWIVLTGCEEVGCYGAEAFARTHQAQLQGAFWLTVDTVGGEGADPCYLTQETFLQTSRSDPGLIELAKAAAASHPELGARAHRFAGAYTEGAIGAKHGHRVLSFIAVRPDGMVPEWHRPTDVFERIDQEVLGRTEAYIWEVLRAIDARAADLHEASHAA